mgnify:CR=1 FL=1
MHLSVWRWRSSSTEFQFIFENSVFDLPYFYRGHNDFAWYSHLIAAEPGIDESRLHTWMMAIYWVVFLLLAGWVLRYSLLFIDEYVLNNKARESLGSCQISTLIWFLLINELSEGEGWLFWLSHKNKATDIDDFICGNTLLIKGSYFSIRYFEKTDIARLIK